MTTLNEHKAQLMKNPEFRREYEAIQPEYEIVRQILEFREKENVTQAQLAKRVGISRSNITRLESGEYNPSLMFLKKIANGMGKKLHIEFR
jgi:DNA-binding XRE family transcriptional regulator